MVVAPSSWPPPAPVVDVDVADLVLPAALRVVLRVALQLAAARSEQALRLRPPREAVPPRRVPRALPVR